MATVTYHNPTNSYHRYAGPARLDISALSPGFLFFAVLPGLDAVSVWGKPSGLDPVSVWGKPSDLYCSPGARHTCCFSIIENMVKDDCIPPQVCWPVWLWFLCHWIINGMLVFVMRGLMNCCLTLTSLFNAVYHRSKHRPQMGLNKVYLLLYLSRLKLLPSVLFQSLKICTSCHRAFQMFLQTTSMTQKHLDCFDGFTQSTCMEAPALFSFGFYWFEVVSCIGGEGFLFSSLFCVL